MRRVLSTSLIYFVLVFAAGFALAPVRILVLQPRLGERLAELIELPVMVLVYPAGNTVTFSGSESA